MLGLAEGMAKGYLPLNRTDIRPYTVIWYVWICNQESRGYMNMGFPPVPHEISWGTWCFFHGETNCFWGPRVSKDPSFWDSKSPQKKVIDDSWLPHGLFFQTSWNCFLLLVPFRQIPSLGDGNHICAHEESQYSPDLKWGTISIYSRGTMSIV
jgi:hypothetical protein